MLDFAIDTLMGYSPTWRPFIARAVRAQLHVGDDSFVGRQLEGTCCTCARCLHLVS